MAYWVVAVIIANDALVDILNHGGIAVIRTDTLYGIVARASDEAAVEQIFRIKQRDRQKPLIVLLADARQAYDHAQLVAQYSEQAKDATTVIVNSPHAPNWLRHQDGTVGYRVPKNIRMRDLLRITGPLVAPSANPQSLPPARTINEAKAYFGDQIACYVDGGTVPTSQVASKIMAINAEGTPVRLR